MSDVDDLLWDVSIDGVEYGEWTSAEVRDLAARIERRDFPIGIDDGAQYTLLWNAERVVATRPASDASVPDSQRQAFMEEVKAAMSVQPPRANDSSVPGVHASVRPD